MKKHLRLGFAAALGMSIGMAANAAMLPNIDIGRAIGAAKDLGTAATGIPESAAIIVHIGIPPVRSVSAVRFF